MKTKDSNGLLKNKVAFLWNESFLWGLMAYKALKANGLSFELIRAEDIKKGCLKNYAMLFVPGGWASNKLKALGDKGTAEIKKFVRNGGNYLGFCGGAGLATLDGIGLLNIKRKPTKERVPSFSGRIHLNVNEHPVWKRFKIQDSRFTSKNSKLQTPNSKLVFHAWWPSQFLIEDSGLKILAAYGNALPDSFSSDLNVGDVEMNSNWTELEEIYGINLNPKRLKNEPAVIEGTFGKGRVILSLIHFDTPDDENGAKVLRNLWNHLTENSDELRVKSYELKKFKSSKPEIMNLRGLSLFTDEAQRSRRIGTVPDAPSLLEELESAVTDLISLGIRNFLWFWRNPMLLQWRRGVRGLEYCTLYIMIMEIAEILKGRYASCVMRHEIKEKSSNLLPITDYLLRIRELLIPFIDKAKHLLILERHAMQNGHITYERCDDPEIQKLRTELFSSSKSYGGLFKELIDEVDKLLYTLTKMETEGQRKHCSSSHS